MESRASSGPGAPSRPAGRIALRVKYLVPLGLFAVFAAFLGLGLGLDPRLVPSPLIDKPAPEFSLPELAFVNVRKGAMGFVRRDVLRDAAATSATRSSRR